MRRLDAHLRRPQLLIALLCACSGGEDPTAARALDYLGTTHDEMGLDVLLATRIYGELAADARADLVVEARRPDLPASDVMQFGVLLDLATPRLAPASLAGVAPPLDTPDPTATLVEDWASSCPTQIVASCDISADCLTFLQLDSWGYVQTHQAVSILIATWRGCAIPFDVEARRAVLASRLKAETIFDPVPSDLYFERLAMLGHLGYASEIAPDWITALRQSQDPQGCFHVNATLPCHPHPTGLALWTLGHALASSVRAP